jgi:hypothetical protein
MYDDTALQQLEGFNMALSANSAIDQPKWEERELRFHPSDPAAAQALTCGQVSHFNDEGYVTGLPVFDGEQVGANRTYFDGLLAQLETVGGDSYALDWCHLYCAGVYDLCRRPAILRYVRDILGDEFVCWGAHYICKMPHDRKSVAWHQDSGYWPMTPSNTVSAWIPIDDVDRENAAMSVIPRSHRKGIYGVRKSDESDGNIFSQIADVADSELDQAVCFEMPAGQMSLHSDLLLHGSGENRSDRRRCAIALRYAAANVRATTPRLDARPFPPALQGIMNNRPWNRRSIHCLKGDPSGHWADVPRPTGDDVASALGC